jgi:peptidoglycan/LPS O-acetylase OafA/YrhL
MAAPAQTTSEPTSTAAVLNPLTSARFAAAFAVMVFHFGGDALYHLPRAVQLIFERGYVSVSFFFVLSGFILTHSYLNGAGRLNSRSFYIARFARIYPVYLLAFVLEAFFVIHQEVTARSVTQASGPLGISALLNLLLLQSWLITSVPEWNVPGWSLSTEAFFYLIFPPVGRAALRLARNGTILALGVTGALVFLPCVIDLGRFAGEPTAHQLDRLGCSPVLRCFEFLTGVFAGRLYQILGPPGKGNLIALSAIALILTLLWTTTEQPLPLWREKALVLLFVLLIFGLAGTSGRVLTGLSTPTAVLLGQASYGLYILHWPLHEIAMAIRRSIPVHAGSETHPGSIFFAIYIALVIAVSVLVLRSIEQPARVWLRSTLS